jgi:hypothetical protein
MYLKLYAWRRWKSSAGKAANLMGIATAEMIATGSNSSLHSGRFISADA